MMHMCRNGWAVMGLFLFGSGYLLQSLSLGLQPGATLMVVAGRMTVYRY